MVTYGKINTGLFQSDRGLFGSIPGDPVDPDGLIWLNEAVAVAAELLKVAPLLCNRSHDNSQLGESRSEFILFYPSSGSINILDVTVQLLKLNNNMKIISENNILYIDTAWYYRGKVKIGLAILGEEGGKLGGGGGGRD